MRSRTNPWHYPTLYGPRNIQQAVFYGRQHMLFPADVYVRAGFRPKAVKVRKGKPTVLKRLLGEQ